jgi:hypothetical protein
VGSSLTAGGAKRTSLAPRMNGTPAEQWLTWLSSVEKEFNLDAYYVYDPLSPERHALSPWLKQLFFTLVLFEFLKGLIPMKELGEHVRVSLVEYVNEIRQVQAAGRPLPNHQSEVEAAIKVMLQEFATLAGADAEAASNYLANQLEAIGMPPGRARKRARAVKERFLASFN